MYPYDTYRQISRKFNSEILCIDSDLKLITSVKIIYFYFQVNKQIQRIVAPRFWGLIIWGAIIMALCQ